MKNKFSTVTNSPLIKGTLILTISGILSRFLGFFYRIFLSKSIGSEGMGLYQLIMPIMTISMSLCVIGIKTAISKYVAVQIATGTQKSANQILISGTAISLLFSTLISIIIYAFADGISTHFLGDIRCTNLIKILVFAIPTSAFHSCITGYCFGTSKATFPAVLQFAEQIFRLGFILLFYLISKHNNQPFTIEICILGLIACEFFSATACLIFLFKEKIVPMKLTKKECFCNSKSILKMSVPLSFSHVIIHFFQSLEIVLLPIMLKNYGYSSSEALSTLGIISGMAIPFILFPSTIASSYSTMLLPQISNTQARKNEKHLSLQINATIKFCITFGIYCLFMFLIYAADIAAFLFGTPSLISYIKMLAFLCPFLYLDITMSSILNGLGKTTLSFINNILVLTIKLLFIVLGTKYMGINSYLYSILVGEVCISIISYIQIKLLTGHTTNISQIILTSVINAFISYGISLLIYITLYNFTCIPIICAKCLCACIATLTFFFMLWLWKKEEF